MKDIINYLELRKTPKKMQKLFLFFLCTLFSFGAHTQNNAFNFTSKTNTITIGNADVSSSWTAEMWVFRKSNVPSNPGASVLLNGTMGKLNLETWGSAYKVGFSYKGKYDQAFKYTVPLNQWVHLAFVFDGNYTYLYVNGVKVDSIYHTMTLPAIDLPLTGIGLNNESPNAYIDEIRVWNTVRTSNEIFASMNTSVDPVNPALIGYWYADDQAIPATDISTKFRSCPISGVTYIANNNPSFVTNIPNISYKTTDVSHNSSSFVTPGAVNQEALLINVQTSGVLGSQTITQLNCNPNGTTQLSDIKNARLYYTAGTKIFSSSKLFGTMQTVASSISFNGIQNLKPGNNYFWLTYDISSTANQGNVIDAECKSVIVDGTTINLAKTSADGSRIIHSALPASPNAISIIPKPQSLVYLKGNFNLSSTARIVASLTTQTEAKLMAEFLRRSTGYALPIVSGGEKKGDIRLHLIPTSVIQNEGYELSVCNDSISITASSTAGLFYGWQTLRQLFPKAIESPKNQANVIWNIPCVIIKDYPRFAYRGFMFDPARYFHSTTFTKKLIDHLSMQKINYLHWHLVDDQGFRFECAKYPTLNSIGSWQSKCGNRGGYYTKTEMRDIVKYAQDRHIEIIPELEIPGHSQEMLASLPILKCTSAPATVDVYCQYGIINQNIMCGGQDTTYKILENILLEYMDIFPSKYIHIGGDEAPKGNWDACTKCTAMKTKLGISSSHGLQAYMTSYFNNFLKKYGKRIIGWEEILDGLTTKEPIAQEWNNSAVCYTALKNGSDVIFSDAAYYYIDMQQAPGESAMGYGYAWKGYNDLQDAYFYDPVLPTLSAQEKSHILGLEACLWGETTVDTMHVEYMLYPRLFAVGEGMWSDKTKDYSDFYTRIANRMAVVDSMKTYHRNLALDVAPAVITSVDTIYCSKPTELTAKAISEHYYWSDASHSSSREITATTSGVYSVYYTIGNRMLENKYIVIMETTGITSPSMADEKSLIYPNPNKGFLSIRPSVNSLKSVRINTLIGQTLMHKLVPANNLTYRFSVANLPKGTYILELTYANNDKRIQKFIKD